MSDWATILQDWGTTQTAAWLSPYVPLVIGTNSFLGKTTDDVALPDYSVVFTPYDGPTLENLGDGSGDIDIPGFQISVRSARKDFAGGSANAWRLFRLYRGITDRTISGQKFHRVAPKGTPSPQGQDSSDRYQWLIDFSVWIPPVVEPII